MNEELDHAAEQRIRHLAQIEIESLSSFIDRILDQHADDFKWLTASLMLLNSGAIAGVINTDAISIYGKQVSSSFYIVGIVFCLLIAVASQLFGRRSLPPLLKYRAYWISISQGEVYSAEAEQEAATDFKRSQRLAWIVPILGWLSAIAFIAGSVSAGRNLVDRPNSPPHAEMK